MRAGKMVQSGDMDRNAISREAIRLGLQLAAVLAAYAIVGAAGLHQFTSNETEAMNTLIVMVGSIYAVILAFVIFVIWGQFTEVENCVMRECNSLGEMLRFSDFLPAEFARSIRKCVGAYVQQVIKHEWRALGGGRRDKRSEDLFSDLMTTVITGAQSPSNDPQVESPMHLRLIDMARLAGERRSERVSKCLTRIPPTMFWFVNMIAAALILLVFVYPFHHRGAGMVFLALVAILLLLANFVMRDMDNPLDGAWNVSPRPFQELRPRRARARHSTICGTVSH